MKKLICVILFLLLTVSAFAKVYTGVVNKVMKTDANGVVGWRDDADSGGAPAWGSITGTLSAQTDLQTALDLKSPLASPIFTGTVTIPTPFTLGAVSVLPTGTELNFVDGVTSAIQTQLDGKQASGSYLTSGGALGTPSSGTLANCTFPTLNQNTTGSAATLTTPRTIDGVSFDGSANIASPPYATGSSASTSATTGTMTVNMTTDIITITPTGACTFNAAAGGNIGQIVTFSITTSGTTSYTLTWGTNYRKTGTLATGTTSARFFAVTFRYVATNTWMEIARTAVQT